jgi:signal transduction histidine kinase
MNTPELLQRCYTAMAKHYNTIKNNDSTVKYQALIIQTNGKLFDSKQAQQFKNIDFDEQQRQAQIEAAQKDYRQKMGTYALLAGLALFLFIAFILWRSSRQRKLANIQLSRQKRELEAALETLKTTQSQLIQSEKMASLGELTAGIAHEIQNPLNFVNNFSEVNQELLEELRNEEAKPKSERNEQLEDDLLTSIEQNLEKINHHGKRADAIVKGMLQHSRASSPQKEPIDVNALVDEYLRLAYHGLRAKDKSFNTKFETDFDPLLQKIIAVPQEIGRVVLNLINNAFYSVSEKSKLLQEGSFAVVQGYEPKIYVSTKKMNGNTEIRVRDNGMGIPAEIADKIFQPFFTTKPAGQGTGLGLSLAYDIITKGHGGELKVTTEEGEGTEFVIVLPITSEQ